MLQRRHYQTIAETLANSLYYVPENLHDAVIEVWLKNLAHTNPRFNASRFAAYVKAHITK